MSNVAELAAWRAELDDGRDENFEILQPSLIPVQAPPLKVLPAPLKEFVEAASKSLNCPPDYIFMPLLMAAGSAIGRNRVAKPKPDWKEFAVVWLGLIGDPSTGKTPAISVVMDPLKRIQREYYKSYRDHMDEYEEKLAEWQQAKKKKPKPAEPTMKMVLSTDATLEALRDLLSTHPKGVTLLQGELKGWLLSMNQYKGSGRGNDRQVWLDLWSSELAATARKSGNVLIADPFVGVLGGLQPDVLEALTTEGRDGFIARVLLVYPDRTRLRYDANSSIPESLQSQWREMFDRLWDLKTDKDDEPVEMPFTDNAKYLFSVWLNEKHLLEIESGGLSLALVDVWSKLRAYLVRIALILQCMRTVEGEAEDQEIDHESVSRAIDIVEYLKSHLRRAYNELHRNPNQEWITGILEFLKTKQRISSRDVQRARILPNASNKASEVERLFHEIADLGYAKLERASKGSLQLYLPAEDGDPE